MHAYRVNSECWIDGKQAIYLKFAVDTDTLWHCSMPDENESNLTFAENGKFCDGNWCVAHVHVYQRCFNDSPRCIGFVSSLFMLVHLLTRISKPFKWESMDFHFISISWAHNIRLNMCFDHFVKLEFKEKFMAIMESHISWEYFSI